MPERPAPAGVTVVEIYRSGSSCLLTFPHAPGAAQHLGSATRLVQPGHTVVLHESIGPSDPLGRMLRDRGAVIDQAAVGQRVDVVYAGVDRAAIGEALARLAPTGALVLFGRASMPALPAYLRSADERRGRARQHFSGAVVMAAPTAVGADPTPALVGEVAGVTQKQSRLPGQFGS